MNNILVILVVGVASLAVWLRIRKNVHGDRTQPWFTSLQTKETDPHTGWFDLLRQIEGDPMQDSGAIDAAVNPQPPASATDTPTKKPTATVAVEPPPQATLYLQWSTNAASSILRSDGLPSSANQVGNEVGWWEPVRQANVVNTFAVRGKDTTLDAIPIRIGMVSLPVDVDANNRPVIRLPANTFLVLPHETPSVNKCSVFLVMQWETEVVGMEELVGQMHIGVNNELTVGLVLAERIADKVPPTQTPPGAHHEASVG